MKVDVVLKGLTNAQVAAALLLLPEYADGQGPTWQVSRISYGSADLQVMNVETSVLGMIFFELKEREIQIVSNRKGRGTEGY